MTLLIKVAGGRELVMVYLGARVSHFREIDTPWAQLWVASIVPRGSPHRVELLTDRVCIELLMRDYPRFRPRHSPLAVNDGTGREVNAIGHFQHVKVPVRY
jgi:hypothetical protein